MQSTLELFESAKKFQIIMGRAVRDWLNHKKHFNLKLQLIGNVRTFKLVVHSENESHKYCVGQPNGTYICRCTFRPSPSRETTDITTIMRSDTERLDWGLLNNNATSPHLKYSVVKTKNRPQNGKDDTAFWNEYSDHLRDCKWMSIDDTLLLFLYQAQIQNVHIFYNRLDADPLHPPTKQQALLSPMDVDEFSQSRTTMDIDEMENQENTNRTSDRFRSSTTSMESRQEDVADLSPENKIRAIVGQYGWTEISAKNMVSFRKCGQRMNVWLKKRERITMRVQPLDKTNPEWKSRKNITIAIFRVLMAELASLLTPNGDQISEDDAKEKESGPLRKKRRVLESNSRLADRPKCPTNIVNAVFNSKPPPSEVEGHGENVIQSAVYHKSIGQCRHRLVAKVNFMDDLAQWVLSLFHDAKCPPNESQCTAICKSLLSPLSLIHGPPGTGKTATSADLVAAILALQAQNTEALEHGKIIVSGYTHASVNQLLRKIAESPMANPKGCPRHCGKGCQHLDLLRLGDADRCPGDLQPFCLQKKVEIEFERLKKGGMSALDLHQKAVNTMYNGAKVVVGTAYSLVALNRNYRYDWLLIDECTQILDPVLNIAVNALDIRSNPHLIMIGDHKQLPPLIRSDKLKKGYQSLFETLATTAEKEVDPNRCGFYTMLRIQYRMPQILMQFSNLEFYRGRIESYLLEPDGHPVYQQIDNMMEGINEGDDESIDVLYKEGVPLYIVSLKHAVAEVADNAGGKSKKNEDEVRLIVDQILPHFDSSVSVGVISLYKPQAQRIKELVRSFRLNCNDKRKIMTSTVDAFQGMEKDVIILSLVTDVTKNTRFGNKEFSKDPNRMNVALTRCSKALIVVTSANLRPSDDNLWTRFFDRSMRLLTEE